MDEFGLINYLEQEQGDEDTSVGVKDNLYHNHVDILFVQRCGIRRI